MTKAPLQGLDLNDGDDLVSGNGGRQDLSKAGYAYDFADKSEMVASDAVSEHRPVLALDEQPGLRRRLELGPND
jgi:hypothetical protein